MTIYYLGPMEEDFEDAQRLLLQVVRGHTASTVDVKYGASPRNKFLAPIPVEVGHALPLAERTGHWARWTQTAQRQMEYPPVKGRSRLIASEMRKDDSANFKTAAQSIEKRHDIAGNFCSEPQLVLPQNSYWMPNLRQDMSVTLGRVVYRKSVTSDLNVGAKRRKGSSLSVAMRRSIDMPHEFVISTTGMKPCSPLNESHEQSDNECLLIKMSPKEGLRDPPAPPPPDSAAYVDPPNHYPDLEIWLDIDREQQMLRLKDVRAVFNSIQTDILLPQLPTDLRFTTELSAASSTISDPRIQAYIKASDLNIWGAGRLKTPSSLILEVPILERDGTGSNGR